MFSTVNYLSMVLLIVAALVLPFSVVIWWLKTRHEKITTMLLGAATFFVFALVFENIVHVLVLNVLPTGKIITGSVVLYSVYGALMAGLFEETGRFITFTTFLKNRKNRETSITYGIGHGGFEAMYILGLSGVQYLLYAFLIENGKLQGIIDAAAGQGQDVSVLEALPEQISSLGFSLAGVSIIERVFAMTAHIAFSIIVFYAVKKSKVWLYALSVLLHASLDVPAALYQTGVINMYVVEIIIAVYAVVLLAVVYNVLYKKDIAVPESINAEVS